MVKKIRAHRIFSDNAGKMNQSIEQVGGSLLIGQFTLVADTGKVTDRRLTMQLIQQRFNGHLKAIEKFK